MHHYNNPAVGSATDRTSFIWRVAIHLFDGTRQDVHGYVRRDSELGQKLFEKLKDAKWHAFLIEIAYPKHSRDTSIVVITRLLGFGHRERAEEYGAAAPTSTDPQPKASAATQAATAAATTTTPPAATPVPAVAKPAAPGPNPYE